MDKYEYRLKAEQIEKLVKKKDYKTAAKIADTIDWRRVKNLSMLYIVAEIYEELERYEDCMEILNIAYDRAPVGRMLLYKMTETATKMHNFEDAISLYREFVKLAPHDQSRYILKYQIYRERGSKIEDQIKILREYKAHEYQEKWAYELAECYAKAGMTEECVRECDELILWFSEGEYVAKAMELKMQFEPLTAAQQAQYDRMLGNSGAADIHEDDFEEQGVPTYNTDKFSTVNLQAELAANLDELLQSDSTIEIPPLTLPEPEPPSEKEEVPQTEIEEAEPEIKLEELTLETPPAEPETQKPEDLIVPDLEAPEVEPIEKPEPEQPAGQMTIEDVLAEWENKKAETEAKIEAEAGLVKARREKVRQETAELMKLIAGDTSRLPRDVKEILDEIDEESRQKKEGSGKPEEPLPQIEPSLEEEGITLEELKLPEETKTRRPDGDSYARHKKNRVSGDTAAMNMIQELEKSLATEVSEMAVNAGHLTKEQARLFAYFTSVKGMSGQLAELFKGNVRPNRKNSSNGNLVITGKRGNGKTTLAIDIVKALQKQNRIEGKKLAKISGRNLNTKDVQEVLGKVKGGALIIENAGALSDSALVALSLAMEGDTGGLLIILEDSAEAIQKIFYKNKNFSSKFDHTIDIPVFTNDELIAFAKSYALELNCTFDEFGVLALYDRIGSRQTLDHMVSVAEVKDIVDGAISHAEKRNVRHLFEKIAKKNVDEFGNRILREEDFEVS